MRHCPDCPEDNPQPARDQRAWAQDGRCVDCHEAAMNARALRRAARREYIPRPVPVNWARV